MNREKKRKWITTVTHDPADRQADGRCEGIIVHEKRPMKEIRWKGLYDKNSDMQYAPRQLIPKSHYEDHFERTEENRASKYRKLMDGVKKELVI